MRILLCNSLLLFSSVLFTQNYIACRQLISPAGSHITSGDRHIAYSYGEVFINTLRSGNITLTQGFQQPETCQLTEVGTLALPAKPSLLIYPNPTTDGLRLRWPASSDLVAYRFRIYGADGQLIQDSSADILAQSHDVPLHHLPAGAYWLEIKLTDQPRAFTQSFIKQ